jgi:hypothetical protein
VKIFCSLCKRAHEVDTNTGTWVVTTSGVYACRGKCEKILRRSTRAAVEKPHPGRRRKTSLGSRHDPEVSPTRVSTLAPVDFRTRVLRRVATWFLEWLYAAGGSLLLRDSVGGALRHARTDELERIAERFAEVRR